MSAALIISLKFSFFYFVKTFACLQMYIASRAAAASTASEIIVNIIIVTLSLIFKLLILKTFFLTSLGFLIPF